MMKEARKLVEEANELKQICIDMMLNEHVFDNMDGETFEICKKMFNMIDTSTKLVLEQAALFETMDSKLDKLLSMKEES